MTTRRDLDQAIRIRDLERDALLTRAANLNRLDREPKYVTVRQGSFEIRRRVRRSPLWAAYMEQYRAWLAAVAEVDRIQAELLDRKVVDEARDRV